jgi:uncharacterized protein YabN with tetrapyrrole methylase and pyrophosphatase domain
MIKAYRIQDKAGQVGFEWDDKADVWAKVKEEMAELLDAEKTGDPIKIKEEFGDLMFAMINYARYINVDPETALDATNRKFIRRFQYIEDNTSKALKDMSLDEMEMLWQEAKREEMPSAQ